MPRRSSTQITKDHAVAIAVKLRATVKKKKQKAHDLAVVHVNGQRVASFGIRRSSRGSIGHDFIPKRIHVSPRECKELAECTISYDEWVEILRDKQIIPN